MYAGTGPALLSALSARKNASGVAGVPDRADRLQARFDGSQIGGWAIDVRHGKAVELGVVVVRV